MTVASGFAMAVVIVSVGAAGGWTTRSSAGSVMEAILPAGTILHFFPFVPPVPFTVPIEGAVLVGVALVGHHMLNMSTFPADSIFMCPEIPVNVTYSGSSWWYTANEDLSPGQYRWGSPCNGWGANVTVTHPLELLYP
jgi:hypothetical protein